jgi:homoserine kinase
MEELQIEYGRKVKIHSPATIANIVCGFDVLGMALNDPYDEMELSISKVPGIRIRHTDNFNLPEQTE